MRLRSKLLAKSARLLRLDCRYRIGKGERAGSRQGVGGEEESHLKRNIDETKARAAKWEGKREP